MKRLVAFFFLIGCSPAFGEVLSINQFSGLNTDVSSLVLQNGQTPDSENVITDEPPSLEPRKGYIKLSTYPATDQWTFSMSDGTKHHILLDGTTLYAATNSQDFDTEVATVASGVRVSAAQIGDKWFFVNQTDGLQYWDGTSVTVASSTLTCSLLVAHKGRLWAAGHSSFGRTLFGSEFNDGTDWTLVADPADTDPTQIILGGALDENISGLYSSFQDKLMWFKANSFGGLFGSKRSNFIQRSFSDTIGLSDVDTIQDCDGRLRWLGQRREVWEFDGATYYKISEAIDGILDTIAQGDAISKSHTETTQSDWEAGETVSGFPSSSSVPGSLSLSTITVSDFTDTTTADFSAGTLTNLSASSNKLFLTIGSTGEEYSCDGSDTSSPFDSSTCANDTYQSFQSTYSYKMNGLTFRVQKTGSVGSIDIDLLADSGGSPGSKIADLGSVLSSDVGTSMTTISKTFTAQTITKNTRYWLFFDASNSFQSAAPFGPCTTGTNVAYTYEVNNSPCNTTSEKYGPSGTSTTIELDTVIDGFHYPTTGTITSQSFDVGYDFGDFLWTWGDLTSNSTLNGGTITFETQTSTDSSNWESLQSLSGNAIQSTEQRYIRYKGTIVTADENTTPELNDVTLGLYEDRVSYSTAVYTTDVIEIGDGISLWGPVGISETDPRDEITYEFNASTNSSIDDFTEGDWESIVQGGIPTLSTAPYAAFRITIDASSGTVLPQVNDLTVNWTEGTTIRSASAYFDQRYWLAVSISSNVNNKVLVYDKLDQWQRYSIPATSLHVHNANLYHTDSNGFYQDDTGYDDNGTNITAYYTTKTLFPSGSDLRSYFDYLWMTTEQSDSTLATTYEIDENGTETSLGSVQMNTTTGIQNFKLPFSFGATQNGNFFNLKWTVTGSDFWRIVNGNLYYQPSAVTE